MALQTWQVGLDIQNEVLCALGIQHRRNGWQLRHWWRYALPKDTLRNGILQPSPQLIQILRRWRTHLPRKMKLCVGFPPQNVLQRHVTLPPGGVDRHAMAQYVNVIARQLFPMELDNMVLDYRNDTITPSLLCITAARKEALMQWVDTLRQAGLAPDVLELTPTALGVLSLALRQQQAITLVHQASDHWIWFDENQPKQPGGWCPNEAGLDLVQLRQRHFPHAALIYSSQHRMADPVVRCLPLTVCSLLQPVSLPLPASDGQFVLALGLAMRPEDRQ